MAQYIFDGTGATFFCPNCMHEMSRALPVEPLFTSDEVVALVPCTIRWLRRYHNESYMNEPIYMLTNERRRRRMYTARDVRNLRKRRLAQHARTTNRIEADYEYPTK